MHLESAQILGVGTLIQQLTIYGTLRRWCEECKCVCLSVCVSMSGGEDDPLFHCGFFFKLLTCARSQSLSACPLIRRDGGGGWVGAEGRV